MTLLTVMGSISYSLTTIFSPMRRTAEDELSMAERPNTVNLFIERRVPVESNRIEHKFLGVVGWKWNFVILESPKAKLQKFHMMYQVKSLIFVAVFGQVRAVCLDGFSDHCIFVSVFLLLLLKRKVFTSSFFWYVPSPWSWSRKTWRTFKANKHGYLWK